VTFASEITVDVEVEVLDYTPPTAGRYGDRPDRCFPAEGEAVDLVVRLGPIDITAALPADVLEALASEALEQLLDP